jgi:hypothetical protein
MLPLGPLATAVVAEGAGRKEGPESSNLLFVNERGGDGAKKKSEITDEGKMGKWRRTKKKSDKPSPLYLKPDYSMHVLNALSTS